MSQAGEHVQRPWGKTVLEPERKDGERQDPRKHLR